MDDIVLAAMRKWPHVPACYGWLALDLRGDWYMRDERVQSQGPFPQAKGSRITHDKLRDFIHRNYTHDEKGAWFFQNGPQKVFVELELAPWVWRLQPDLAPDLWRLQSHTALTTTAQNAFLDECDRLWFITPLGAGVLHSQDTVHAPDALTAWQLEPQSTTVAHLQTLYPWCVSPQARKALS